MAEFNTHSAAKSLSDKTSLRPEPLAWVIGKEKDRGARDGEEMEKVRRKRWVKEKKEKVVPVFTSSTLIITYTKTFTHPITNRARR